MKTMPATDIPVDTGGLIDLLIVNARVCDGTGQPWYPANVAVNNGRILAVGVASRPACRQTIDARGCMLAPGFIDVHTHADAVLQAPTAVNLIRQGVTTVVSGNCGISAHPVGEHLDRVARCRPALNYATLVGQGQIRRAVMGMSDRRPTRRDIRAMCRLAEQAMQDGAIGLSSGIFYVPGAWSTIAEVATIARVAAAWGGVYATHKRSAGGKIMEAIDEAAAVGRQARIPVQISHLKVFHRRGRTGRSRMADAMARIRRYREESIDIAWDTHPFPATNTHLSAVVIPEWVSEGGHLAERLRDKPLRKRIRGEVAGKIAWMGGACKIQLTGVKSRTLDEVAAFLKTDPVTAAMDLVIDVNPSCIFHALRQDDVDAAVIAVDGMIASDGGVITSPRGMVHPRNFGTFPRVLGHYVRERKLLPIEVAVSKMTLMPARKFGLRDRGRIAPGQVADMVLFDPQRIGSKADFVHPRALPTGIRRVFVNGQTAWRRRGDIDARWGTVIRGCREI